MTTKSKSSIAINKIRTGNGDGGYTTLAGKKYSKGAAVVQYLAELDVVQSFTTAVPEEGLIEGVAPRALLQELMFRLGAALASRGPKKELMAIAEIRTAMEYDLDAVTRVLKPLDSFLRTTLINATLQQLRAHIRRAEVACVAAHDRIEFESADTSLNLLEVLRESMKALNVASDWVFAYLWLFTCDDKGAVQTRDKWIPLDIDALRSSNDSLAVHDRVNAEPTLTEE